MRTYFLYLCNPPVGLLGEIYVRDYKASSSKVHLEVL